MEGFEIGDRADTAAGNQGEVGVNCCYGAAEIESADAGIGTDVGQVEDNELGDACICHSIDDSERIARPCISGSRGGFSDQGGAVFEVEAEEEFLGAKLSDPVRKFAGIGEGLEGENDAGGTATEKPAGLFEIADAHVDVELESIGDEPTECLPMGDFAHESVEVGDVESFESEIVPDGAGDIERAGGIGELGNDGLVFIASSADAANDVALHEIEDGNDFHGTDIHRDF